jgi:2-phosphosulfolactate phosphatase
MNIGRMVFLATKFRYLKHPICKKMRIKKLKLTGGAAKAKGLVVIIDVFRAFSVSCYLISKGVARIYTVGSVEEAFRLKEVFPDAILIGERHEIKCEGFDFGNSPTHILTADFTGKTVIHTTSSGTQGISLAVKADEIITGSFVNAKAIASYLKKKNPVVVSLVSMGYEGIRSTQEDDFCADYIENLIENKETDFDNMVEIIRTGDGARLLDPKNHIHSPATDFSLCMNRDVFNFVLRVRKDIDGRNYLERIDV